MEQVTTTAFPVEVNPTMNWGAILAGWAVGLGIAGLLYIGGLALGFSAFDADNAASTAKGIGIGAASWVVLTWAASLFVGGMFASWFDGKDDETMGSMHGVAVWGVSVAVSAVLAMCAAGHAAHAAGSAAAGGASMFSQAYGATQAHGQSDAIMANASAVLRAQLTKAANGAGGSAPATAGATTADTSTGSDSNAASGVTNAGDAASAGSAGSAGSASPQDAATKSAPSFDAVVTALIQGDNETAKTLLSADTSLSSAQIDTLIQTESEQVEQYKAKAKEAANAVAKYSAMIMWIAFASSLLGLLFAAIGGWLGSNHVHRVYHLRTYRQSVTRS